MKTLIAIDPGHGLNTAGKRTPAFPDGSVMLEREFNKAVAIYLEKMLKEQGFDVINVAVSDTDVPLNKRTALANNTILNKYNRPADFYISIHANAFGGGEWNEANGIETYVHPIIPANSATERIARNIHKQLIAFTERRDRGLKRSNFQVLRETNMPAALVECGFMTNLTEAELLKTDAYREACAEAIAKGICESFEVNSTEAGRPIVGKATATAARAKAWAKDLKAAEFFIELADTFWPIAEAVGVNPVAAYCQSAKETGYGKFGGVLDATYYNPCGLKNTSGGGDYDKDAHKRFTSWAEGIQAQVDHLALYAGAAGYPKKNTPDPRHFDYLLGKCKTVEALGGGWAPSKTYGEDIAKMMRELENTKAAEPKPATGNIPDWQVNALKKLVAEGIIKSPEYWENKLDQTITVGEMFAVIANM